jgi:hypothetical protein
MDKKELSMERMTEENSRWEKDLKKRLDREAREEKRKMEKEAKEEEKKRKEQEAREENKRKQLANEAKNNKPPPPPSPPPKLKQPPLQQKQAPLPPKPVQDPPKPKPQTPQPKFTKEPTPPPQIFKEKKPPLTLGGLQIVQDTTMPAPESPKIEPLQDNTEIHSPPVEDEQIEQDWEAPIPQSPVDEDDQDVPPSTRSWQSRSRPAPLHRKPQIYGTRMQPVDYNIAKSKRDSKKKFKTEPKGYDFVTVRTDLLAYNNR